MGSLREAYIEFFSSRKSLKDKGRKEEDDMSIVSRHILHEYGDFFTYVFDLIGYTRESLFHLPRQWIEDEPHADESNDPRCPFTLFLEPRSDR